MKFSPLPCHLDPLTTKHSPQHPLPQPTPSPLFHNITIPVTLPTITSRNSPSPSHPFSSQCPLRNWRQNNRPNSTLSNLPLYRTCASVAAVQITNFTLPSILKLLRSNSLSNPKCVLIYQNRFPTHLLTSTIRHLQITIINNYCIFVSQKINCSVIQLVTVSICYSNCLYHG
jgi:hypothetical protein